MASLHYLGTFLLTGILILSLRPLAVTVGLVDIPGGRKTQLQSIPLVGGLGIFLGILCTSLFVPTVFAEFGSLLSLAALVLFMGTVDDAKELTPFVRITGQSLVAVAMAVVAGIQLESLGNLLSIGEIDLGILAIPVTVFAAVGVINAINMADGIDGLSGGLVIVSLGFIGLLSYSNGQYGTTTFCILTSCSIMAFLSLNFRRPWKKKALVYLGDAGSTMLGFVLAWLMIDATQGESASFAPVYALWFLTVPLFDTVNLLIKRPLRGLSPVTPGLDHIHHKLLARGFSVEQVVAILLTASVLFGGIGLIGHSYGVNDSSMFVLFVALFITYFILSDRIKDSQDS